MTLKKVIGIVSSLPSEYVPPNCHHVSGDILTSIYDTNMDQEMKSLVLHAEIFDVTLFGGGDTIMTFPVVNYIGTGVHNICAMLDVFDCCTTAPMVARRMHHTLRVLFCLSLKS